jgi:hypothetical protein
VIHPENPIFHAERGVIHLDVRGIPPLLAILKGVTLRDAREFLHKVVATLQGARGVTHQDVRVILLLKGILRVATLQGAKEVTHQDVRVILRKVATKAAILQDVKGTLLKGVTHQDARGIPRKVATRAAILQDVKGTLLKGGPLPIPEDPQGLDLSLEGAALLMHRGLLDLLCLVKQGDFVLLQMNLKGKEGLQGLLSRDCANLLTKSSANIPPSKK